MLSKGPLAGLLKNLELFASFFFSTLKRIIQKIKTNPSEPFQRSKPALKLVFRNGLFISY
ncbi:hypothetical protein X474_01990 [Dethiosulfatarculus sandiegensis]|uniref:Uncharacterized protein n=1 Tax=Dethiosulfatarculus sandiegensis TaxID=1429043 RepID=A0A0D2JC03_9BACT|nr:hypothetical protein X474_01990 [Dethiosulfatarculus sandiegensis]